jgi:hypothetical protein
MAREAFSQAQACDPDQQGAEATSGSASASVLRRLATDLLALQAHQLGPRGVIVGHCRGVEHITQTGGADR